MKKGLAIALLCTELSAFEMKPWLGNYLEFEFDAAYTYYRFTKVNNACKQISSPWNNQLLAFDLSLPLWETVSLIAETEFAHTPKQPWGYRSAAIEARYQCLDDIIGDPISLVLGFNYRNVSYDSNRDVSSPYHARQNIEANVSIGKEWDYRQWWLFRLFGFVGLGIGSKGSPWNLFHIEFQANAPQRYYWNLFAESYIGYGGERTVDVNCFDGWGPIQHRSIDLGVGFNYRLSVWGTIALNYIYRPYAHSYPQNVNFLVLSYRLPFSIF
jgi:hypothetical protein